MLGRFHSWGTGSIANSLVILSTAMLAQCADAKDPDHWAFRSVKRSRVPAVRARSWARTPIDAFVLAELEKKGLKPSSPADRRTLLRRVYLDLIGLPPTPQEQRAFLEDTSPEAYAKVVEDLLS